MDEILIKFDLSLSIYLYLSLVLSGISGQPSLLVFACVGKVLSRESLWSL